MSNIDFIQALTENDIQSVRAAPKTDVHSHAFLSTRLENLENWVGHSVTKPPHRMNGLEEC